MALPMNNNTNLAIVDRPLDKMESRVSYLDKGEPIDSPGIVPAHLKRRVTAQLPLLEILQRFLYRLQPTVSLEVVLAAITLYNASEPVYKYLKRFLGGLLTSQVTVSEHDPTGRDILAYMSAKVMSKSFNTKAMLVTGSSNEISDPYMREYMLSRYGQKIKEPEEVRFLPPIGQKIFWVGFRPFLFSRTAPRQAGSSPRYSDGQAPISSTISLVTLGWSLKPLQNFVKLCHDYKVANSGETTTIFFSGGVGMSYDGLGGGGTWRSVTKAIRKMDTIDIDAHMKADIIQDAEQYYSAEAKKFYTDVGIPFRRGYLFHGPPGTGKTSFSSALAGHLKCDIYMINLATGDVSDSKLHSLFLSLPRKCVVVIEDIDSCGIGRELEAPPAPAPTPGPFSAAPPHHQSNGPRRTNKVTLSGLLNAIDGNASQEGRLLILTSNNPDALDEALTRPGRIDKTVCFGNLSAASARGMFERLIGRAAISSGQQTFADIEEKAAAFARQLPSETFTPAQVQGFLQQCRGDADKALITLHSWVSQTAKSEKPETNGVTSPSAHPPTNLADIVAHTENGTTGSGPEDSSTQGSGELVDHE